MGLETALYARFLGYEVAVYERGSEVAANVASWSHVRLFTPFAMNATPLGVAAISAQQPGWQPPAATALLTGQEFRDAYLTPLAATDLLADSLQLNQQVVSIGRPPLLKGQLGDQRSQHPFQVLISDNQCCESTATADIVIDTSGVYGNHNWLGQGGMPAIGELRAESELEYGIPDVLGRDRASYADRHTVVVGAGASAATTVVALAELAKSARQTRLTWITRGNASPPPDGPITRIPGDRLPERDRLGKQANALAADSGCVAHLPGTYVTHIATRSPEHGITVQLGGSDEQTIEADRVVANVGYRPDRRIYEELQVHECFASQGPMKIAANLLSSDSPDCLDQAPGGSDSLLLPDPGFFILGSKSYGRNSQFLLATGFSQIQQLFTIIGGRSDLDLYATMPPLTA